MKDIILPFVIILQWIQWSFHFHGIMFLGTDVNKLWLSLGYRNIIRLNFMVIPFRIVHMVGTIVWRKMKKDELIWLRAKMVTFSNLQSSIISFCILQDNFYFLSLNKKSSVCFCIHLSLLGTNLYVLPKRQKVK